MSTLGALASGFISLSKFPSSASNIEQIWVELNGIDSRSLPPLLKMDARIVGVKLFTHLGRVLLRNQQRTLDLLPSPVDFKFSMHRSLGDLVITDVRAPTAEFLIQ